jgi:hypothetical protein
MHPRDHATALLSSPRLPSLQCQHFCRPQAPGRCRHYGPVSTPPSVAYRVRWISFAESSCSISLHVVQSLDCARPLQPERGNHGGSVQKPNTTLRSLGPQWPPLRPSSTTGRFMTTKPSQPSRQLRAEPYLAVQSDTASAAIPCSLPTAALVGRPRIHASRPGRMTSKRH